MSRGLVRLFGREVELRTDPFVHGVIDGLLPPSRYHALAATFVEPEGEGASDAYADGKRRIHFGAPPVPGFLEGNAPWREFVAEISSARAIGEMRDLCAQAAALVPARAPYDQLERRRSEIASNDFRLYCEFSSLRRGARLRPHTDATFKFLSFVYYFAPPTWDGTWDGATEIYGARDDRGRFNWANRELEARDVERVGRCEFVPNRLFFFVKGSRSLHGVAPVGCPPDVRRRTFNFALEVPRARYEASPAGECDREVCEREAWRWLPSLVRRILSRARRMIGPGA